MNTPLTISETQDKLLKKEIRAVEIAEEFIDNIKKKNNKLNALITVCEEEIYKKSKEIDNLLKTGDKNILDNYPLLGAFCVFKDNFLTKGIRTTAGSKLLSSYVPNYSATAVKNILGSGAVMVGKSNCDAWAHGASGENSDYEATKNPWNLDFVPGGSSSGSAASLAANFCNLATGTDTGGSIRQPANFCYVYGHKPTYGLVSRFGVIAMSSSLDTVGSFTRSAEDARKVFRAIKGKDNLDATLEDNIFKGKIKKTIGIPKEYFIKGLDREVEENINKAIKIFEGMGYIIKRISLPHTKYAISVYYIVQPAEVSSNLARFDGIRFGSDRNDFSAEAKRRIMLGTYVLSSGYYDAYYLKAMKVRVKIEEDFANAFEEVDFILAPVSPTPAFRLGDKSNDPLKMYLADIFTVAANLSGIPALSVPFGINNDGLPLGFQIMGPKYSDEKIIDAAEGFEREVSYKPKVASI